MLRTLNFLSTLFLGIENTVLHTPGVHVSRQTPKFRLSPEKKIKSTWVRSSWAEFRCFENESCPRPEQCTILLNPNSTFWGIRRGGTRRTLAYTRITRHPWSGQRIGSKGKGQIGVLELGSRLSRIGETAWTWNETSHEVLPFWSVNKSCSNGRIPIFEERVDVVNHKG